MDNKEDIANLILPLATKFWGNPTSTKADGKIRFGSHGSKAIDTSSGTWFDFEQGIGGGVIDLIKTHISNTSSISEFLEHEFNIPAVNEERQEVDLSWAAVGGGVTETYTYCDKNNKPILVVTRKPGKKFLQATPDGQRPSSVNMEIVPYHLPELLKNKNRAVIIVEGEKDVHTLESHGFIATTNAGGSSSWKQDHANYLFNRNIVILPDNDEAGSRWANSVIKTLFGKSKIKLIKLQGLSDKGDVTDWLQDNTAKDLKLIIKNSDILHTPDTPIPILTMQQITEMQPVPWLIDGLLPERSLAMLYGPSGSGKTFFAMHLLSCIAHNIDFFNRSVNSGAVVLVAGEGVGGLRKRIIAWHQHFEMAANAPVFVVPRAVNIMSGDDMTDLISSIELTVGSQPVKLIVIDTLARAMMGEGDENSTQAMSQAITQLDRLREHFDACVMPVHHTGKSANQGARGSSALIAAVDVSLHLKRDDENIIEVITEKQKDAETISPIFLESKRVEFQQSALDEVESSVVLEEIEARRETKGKVKLTIPQQRVLEALRTAIIEQGRVPNGEISWACVTEIEWRSVALGMSISDTSEDANKKAFKRAADVLLERGVVAMSKKYVWIVDAKT